MAANAPLNPAAGNALAVSIRPARTSAEIEEAAAIYERAGGAAFVWRPQDHFKAADFKRHALEEEVWLAFFGTSILGLLSLYHDERFVHSLYVDLEAQHLGIGNALVRHVRAQSGGPLTLKVDAPNEAAIAFYEHTGWKRLHRPGDSGTDEQGIIWLRYRLD